MVEIVETVETVRDSTRDGRETVETVLEMVERQYYHQPLSPQSRQPPPSMRSSRTSTRRRIVECIVEYAQHSMHCESGKASINQSV